MKLGPGDWRVVLTGNTTTFLVRSGRSSSILHYQLARMVSGEEFSPAELEYWGIGVRPLAGNDEVITVPESQP